MAHTHKIEGDKIVPLTADEIAEFDAKDAAQADVTSRNVIIKKIETLEAEVTQRRIRDAFADPTWMNAQEAKIKTERDKL